MEPGRSRDRRACGLGARGIWSLTATLVVLAPLTLGGRPLQDGAGTESRDDVRTDFAVDSRAVVLHVIVLDADGRAVEGLPRSAFEVYEDGERQRIQLFEPRDVPLAAGLVIDSSSSMLTRRALVRAGVRAFADLSRPGDELFTIVFNEHVRFGLPPGVPFTQSRDLIEASLARAGRGGMTALHDAVLAGLDHLDLADSSARVLVVLADGNDNASEHTRRDMLGRAARSHVVIHTIWTGEISADDGDPGLLRTLARQNGGISYSPMDARGMVEAFQQIARAIRRGYLIGYAPADGRADGRYRRIQVVVRDGRSHTVHTRDGYTARESPLR